MVSRETVEAASGVHSRFFAPHYGIPEDVVSSTIEVSDLMGSGLKDLLILSQVVLSMQLPFAVVPLIQFTSDRMRMGPFVNRRCTSNCI